MFISFDQDEGIDSDYQEELHDEDSDRETDGKLHAYVIFCHSTYLEKIQASKGLLHCTELFTFAFLGIRNKFFITSHTVAPCNLCVGRASVTGARSIAYC